MSFDVDNFNSRSFVALSKKSDFSRVSSRFRNKPTPICSFIKCSTGSVEENKIKIEINS